MGTLTVRENLHFSASLRLSRKLSKRERSKRVEETLSDLGLFHVASLKYVQISLMVMVMHLYTAHITSVSWQFTIL